MFRVNKEKCIGCGLCKQACCFQFISMVDGKAEIPDAYCNACGHCVAICPAQAIETDVYDLSQCVEKKDLKLDLDPQAVLDSLKFRRSVRKFKTAEVEKEKLDRVFEAGRYAPTGSNMQDVRYVLITDEKRMELERMILDGLLNAAAEIDQHPNAPVMFKRYSASWKRLSQIFEESGRTKDVLFFGSKLQIAIIAQSDINAGIAAQAMAAQANAEGLGVLYNGFFRRGVESNPELAKLLGIKDNEKIFTSLCLGYPDLFYQRTAPRNPLNVQIF